MELEFFYDIGSPYSYLAAERVEADAAAAGVRVRWRPFLLGGAFKASGNIMPAANPAKARYMLDDLRRWAGRLGVPFRFPSRFPINTLLPMRVLTAASDEERPALSRRLFAAYWTEDRDVGVADAVRACLGERADALLAAAADQATKDALRRTTDEAVARGAFGAPTFFVGDQMFWGNDRLDFALEAARAGNAQSR